MQFRFHSLGKCLGLAVALAVGLSVSARAQVVPDYYPADYAQIIKAAKAEKQLVVYSTLPASIWKSILGAFNAKFPEITVKTTDFSGDEVFARQAAEVNSGTASADVLVSTSLRGFAEAAESGKVFSKYKSAEEAHLPEWSRPLPGAYTLAINPQFLMYNKKLISPDAAPQGISDIVQKLKSQPAAYEKKLGTYDPLQNASGRTGLATYVKHNPEAWKVLDALTPSSRYELAVGGLLTKLVTGEYSVVYNVTAAALGVAESNRAYKDLIGWNFQRDGTVIIPLGIGMTEKAPNPNAAKLFLDFALSHAGQVAVGQGGMTPYRDDVKKEEIKFFTYKEIVDAVGQENIIVAGPTKKQIEIEAEFVADWKRRLGK